jgi:hypothetical protein
MAQSKEYLLRQVMLDLMTFKSSSKASLVPFSVPCYREVAVIAGELEGS